MEVTIYILLCSDGSYYVGLTKKPVEVRVWEHNEGIVEGYTHSRRPVTLMYIELSSINRAIDREQQLKKWSRKKKEALIRYDYGAFPDLASRPKRPG